MQSARRNHVDALPYLHDLLIRLPAIVPEYLTIGDAPSPFDSLSPDQLAALENLLPDRWLRQYPHHRAQELAAANLRRRTRRAKRRLVNSKQPTPFKER